MFRKSLYLAIGATLCIGCKPRALTVTLTSGYLGKVVVSCTASSDAVTHMQIAADGTYTAACPPHKTELRVVRDNQAVSAQDVSWITTGDNLVSGLTFNVR